MDWRLKTAQGLKVTFYDLSGGGGGVLALEVNNYVVEAIIERIFSPLKIKTYLVGKRIFGAFLYFVCYMNFADLKIMTLF